MEKGKSVEPEKVQVNPKNHQILGRPDIQTIFIDSFIINRTPDDHIILSGIQVTPGMSVEQLRCIVTTAHAVRLAEKLQEIASPKKKSDSAEVKPVSEEKIQKTSSKGKKK